MRKRMYYFCASLVLMPVLLCVWFLIGGIFLMVPFMGLFRPDLLERGKNEREGS